METAAPRILSRRKVLMMAGTGAAVLVAGAVATACGSGTTQTANSSSGSGSSATSAPAASSAGTGTGGGTALKAIDGGALGKIDSSGTVTLNGTGSDIYESGDNYVFADQPWTKGDGDWSTEIVSVSDGSAPVNEWAKVGIMVRESTDPMAAMFLVAATGNHGVINNSRQPGASGSGSVPQQDSTNTTDAGTIGPSDLNYPVWVRVTRKKDTFQAYSSKDGKKWNTLGATVDVAMKTCLVGLCDLSHVQGSTNIAVFKQVTGFVPAKIEQVGNP